MTLIICRDPTPRIPLEYVNHPRTSSLQRLERFIREESQRSRR